MVTRDERVQLEQTIDRMSLAEREVLLHRLQAQIDADRSTESERLAARALRQRELAELLARMDEIRAHTTLEGTSIRELIEEGRRY